MFPFAGWSLHAAIEQAYRLDVRQVDFVCELYRDLVQYIPFLGRYPHLVKYIIDPVYQDGDLLLSHIKTVCRKSRLYDEKKAEIQESFFHDVFCL